MEQRHGNARPDDADQGSWNLGADPGGAQGYGQHAGAEPERIEIGLPQAAKDMEQAHEKMPPLLRYAEQRRKLTDDDVDGDSRQKARRHRDRKQGREPASAEQANDEEDRAHHQRQQRYQLGIVRAAGGGQGCDPAGKDRRDGGVRCHRHEAVGPEGSEGERPRRKGIKPGLRRHAGEPRGASCPGIAIAANISPATKSRGSHSIR